MEDKRLEETAWKILREVLDGAGTDDILSALKQVRSEVEEETRKNTAIHAGKVICPHCRRGSPMGTNSVHTVGGKSVVCPADTLRYRFDLTDADFAPAGETSTYQAEQSTSAP